MTLKLVDLGGGEASWGGRDGGGRTGIVELEMWLRVEFEEDLDDEQLHNGSPNHTENDPEAEVVTLSPRTLMATNRYICEVCHKGFQRDQNLQLHRRGHNLPWKPKQRPTTQAKKRVYICPKPNCVHHDPSRALGDLAGIKKHFCRKHGEKKWKFDKCAKRYAVQSDWKAHAKICGTREYLCDCGTIFSRKDSFVTHRAFCDALTEENYKMNQTLAAAGGMMPHNSHQEMFSSSMLVSDSNTIMNLSNPHDNSIDNIPLKPLCLNSHGAMLSSDLDPIFNPRMPRTASFSSVGNGGTNNSSLQAVGSTYTSATALLQKAAEMGAKISDSSINPILLRGLTSYSTSSSSLNSSGSVHNTSNLIAASAMGTDGVYVASMEAAGGDPRPRYNYVPQSGGLYDEASLFPRPPSNGTATNLMERQVFMGGGEKMTVDFLGVELSPAAAHFEFWKEKKLRG
ncbi:Protein indeterminate-domain like [Actinidia chinensis var. chinensis]|uniref:Protein indeterminate-domain like n=1 Tax=Actinidia chinensis var. chinensis TaxID=1590841 RepID=A0A2R6QRJ5_ACTCC|nr:Protein indeterminate-domain like [Actinidia chinensis var. chinensis]